MAARGPDTLRWGPMKPVGLRDPRTGRRPHAVVQLRQDNALGTLYNMVGFQTKLRHGEQTRIFRMIPGLERAEFARLGGLHRNTFINSPRLLDGALRLKAMPRLRFAGQITGVEGYVESAAIGLLAGRFAAASRLGHDVVPPPATTALGALLRHITGGAESRNFQPMNVNFGLFPPLSPDPGRHADRKPLIARRALADLAALARSRQADGIGSGRRQSSVGRVAVDRVGKLARQAGEQLLPRQPGLLRQRVERVGADRALQLGRRHRPVRTVPDPGIGGLGLSALLETVDQLAEAAAQNAARARAAQIIAELFQHAG